MRKGFSFNNKIHLIFFLLFLTLLPGTIFAEPEIIFNNKVFNFGEIMEGDTTVCLFHFKNEGDTILKLVYVRATCGCTVTEVSKKLIEPGDTGTIKAVFYSARQHGKISKYIFVTTNDKEHKKTMLKIVGQVNKTWKCEPRKVDFGKVRKEAIFTKSVIISCTSVDSIRVDSITVEPSDLSAEILSKKRNRIKVKVSLDTSDIKWKFIGVIRFYSNIPYNRKITIPVYAQLKEKAQKSQND